MLKNVDEPKSWRVSQLVEHASEKGWNLPTDHPRHLFKLPQGMQALLSKIRISDTDSKRDRDPRPNPQLPCINTRGASSHLPYHHHEEVEYHPLRTPPPNISRPNLSRLGWTYRNGVRDCKRWPLYGTSTRPPGSIWRHDPPHINGSVEVGD